MSGTPDVKKSRKEAAVSFLRLVAEGNIREAYEAHVSPAMRHHNAMFPGDAASLEKAMVENHALFPRKILEVKHALEDGDLVAVHSHLRLQAGSPGYAAVHIFRFEKGLIAELWDLIQPIPENSPNANGPF